MPVELLSVGDPSVAWAGGRAEAYTSRFLDVLDRGASARAGASSTGRSSVRPTSPCGTEPWAAPSTAPPANGRRAVFRPPHQIAAAAPALY